MKLFFRLARLYAALVVVGLFAIAAIGRGTGYPELIAICAALLAVAVWRKRAITARHERPSERAEYADRIGNSANFRPYGGFVHDAIEFVNGTIDQAEFDRRVQLGPDQQTTSTAPPDWRFTVPE